MPGGMVPNTELCIQVLAENISEKDDESWSYSGSDAVRLKDRLTPILLEGLNISPDSLRTSEERLEYEINGLILDASKAEIPAPDYVEANLNDFKERLYGEPLSEYHVSFPLNFDRKSRDLLPDTIRVCDVEFHRLPRSEWQNMYLPDFDSNELSRKEGNLSRFLDRSPNVITDINSTYWHSTYSARDGKYAFNRVQDRLELLLAILNYSINYSKIQTTSITSGPWPSRWGDLREPFVYLLYSGRELEQYYWSYDPAPRKAASPHSIFEDSFKDVFDWFPTFENHEPLDGAILNSLRAFQAAITNPDDRESFFEFWRAIEILTLTGKNENMTDVADRAESIISWHNDDVGNIRLSRAIDKRNQYVHEGSNLRITTGDRNLLKSLYDSLLDLHLERRKEWSKKDMKFYLNNMTIDRDQIGNLARMREREIEILDWMSEIAEKND